MAEEEKKPKKKKVKDKEVVIEKEVVTKKDEVLKCRILFVSVLDKILLVVMMLLFIASTWNNFKGDLSGLNYGYFSKVFKEILIIISYIILYFFNNYLYKCAIKTMMCLTDKEVYIEYYAPFIDYKATIPINKITSISTYNLFWIFRFVIICQYSRLPIIFPTWNNKEFKDKLDKMLVNKKEDITNEAKEKNLISKENLHYLVYIAGVLIVIVLLIGLVRMFSYAFSTERNIAGDYTSSYKTISLEKDGECVLSEDVTYYSEDMTDCSWSYNKDESAIVIYYSYKYYGSTHRDSFSLMYDKDNKTLIDDDTTYRKQ